MKFKNNNEGIMETKNILIAIVFVILILLSATSIVFAIKNSSEVGNLKTENKNLNIELNEQRDTFNEFKEQELILWNLQSNVNDRNVEMWSKQIEINKLIVEILGG